jgi:GINS complex subunit 3
MSNYYDIDDILCSSVKVPCIFQTSVQDYGFLAGHDSDDLPLHSRLELPFWLVEPLAIEESVQIETPKFYGKIVQNDLNANAMEVDIRRLCPFFYGFGALFIESVIDQNHIVTRMLFKTFRTRLLQIMNYTQSSCLATMEDAGFLHTLDHAEMELYLLGVATAQTRRKWLDGSGLRLKKSAALGNRVLGRT